MTVKVPFFRPHLGDAEITEVADTLRSGWLTTGPKVAKFEESFAKAVNGKFAVALNSCTAALHLAVEALNLRAGQGVLVPTMTFAATAEIVLYRKAVPILVDCEPVTGNMDLADARRKLQAFKARSLSDIEPEVVGIIPVHVGGHMLDIDAVRSFAAEFGLWIAEDAAHAFPSAWRSGPEAPWVQCGENTANVSCFSFYANKTITTGEGGMAVTNDQQLAERIRLMSLHGLSHDAWGRYSGKGAWDYKIIAPGYKYNLTDIAAAIGLHQLERAEEMRSAREDIARCFGRELGAVDEIELPPWDADRVSSWHLFPIRLNLDRLSIDRNAFIEELKQNGVGSSVHWRPLHMHPLYETQNGSGVESLPEASHLWTRIISLPIFSAMTTDEIQKVTDVVKKLCLTHSKIKISIGA